MAANLLELASGWSDYARALEAQTRVLVVDDDPAARTLFVEALKHAGMFCTAAESGEEALETFLATETDAILADKNLPGMDGLELIKRIQSLDRECEAVLITGYANIDSVLRALDLRAVDYLVKPVASIDMLPATLGKAAERRRRRLMVRRMVKDLQDAVHERAEETDLGLVERANERIVAYRAGLKEPKRVMFASEGLDGVDGSLRTLEEAGYEISWAESADAAVRRSEDGAMDTVITTDRFDGAPGLDLFDRLLELDGRPELVFAGLGDGHDTAIEVLSRGGSAFVQLPLKDDEVLVHAVRRACQEHRERMYHLRLVDELTGVLANLADRKIRPESCRAIARALSDFDVKTGRFSAGTYGGWED